MKSATASSTGTLYDEESFESLKDKIFFLCLSLGFGQPRSLEEFKGGSYNRIIGITFPKSSEIPSCILRIPRHETQFAESSDIKDQVAVLRFLSSHNFPVPHVWAYDVSANNAIGSRYVLQTHMPGVRLSDIYDSLPQEEKKQIIHQMAGLLNKIESIKFPEAGRLAASVSQSRAGFSPNLEVEIVGFGTSHFELDPNAVETKPAKSLLELLFSQFEAWKKHDRNPRMDRGTSEYWDQIIDIAKQMDSLGFLESMEDNENVLFHWDLEPRNILVEKRQGIWFISAVLDWDNALSIPPVLGRKPPIWLWDYSDDPSDWDGDVDLYSPKGLPCIDNTLKEYFDLKIGEHLLRYGRDAYERGRWIRRLARFALYGFYHSQDFTRCNTFVREWKAKMKGKV